MDKDVKQTVKEMVEAGQMMIKAHSRHKKALSGSYTILVGYVKEFIEWQEKIEDERKEQP